MRSGFRLSFAAFGNEEITAGKNGPTGYKPPLCRTEEDRSGLAELFLDCL